MPRGPAQARRRQRELAERLARGEPVATTEMAERLDVNPMTIRRDLEALERSGLAVRCYGGAVPARRISFEFAFDERHRQRLESKRRIGNAAAGRVRGNQTVFLDTGTTTLETARALAGRGVPFSAVTSSLVIASELWGRDAVDLLLLGGRVRNGSPDLAGPATEVLLDRLTAHVAFLGSDGVDPERGFFAEDLETARVSERMVANAERVVVVADSSKLGRAGGVRFARREEVDEIITDREAARSVIASLRRAGVMVTAV